jgi:hypothetical protein
MLCRKSVGFIEATKNARWAFLRKKWRQTYCIEVSLLLWMKSDGKTSRAVLKVQPEFCRERSQWTGFHWMDEFAMFPDLVEEKLIDVLYVEMTGKEFRVQNWSLKCEGVEVTLWQGAKFQPFDNTLRATNKNRTERHCTEQKKVVMDAHIEFNFV